MRTSESEREILLKRGQIHPARKRAPRKALQVRMPECLLERLRASAARNDRSLNAEIVMRLELSLALLSAA